MACYKDMNKLRLINVSGFCGFDGSMRDSDGGSRRHQNSYEAIIAFVLHFDRKPGDDVERQHTGKTGCVVGAKERARMVGGCAVSTTPAKGPMVEL